MGPSHFITVHHRSSGQPKSFLHGLLPKIQDFHGSNFNTKLKYSYFKLKLDLYKFYMDPIPALFLLKTDPSKRFIVLAFI